MISCIIILQTKSQLKDNYKEAAETIIGNCDTSIFLGGQEQSTLMCCLNGCGRKEINLQDYISVKFEGPNGYASAKFNYYTSELIDDIYVKAKDGTTVEDVIMLVNTIGVETDPEGKTNYSNNDAVQVKHTWNEEMAKKLKIKFVNPDEKYEASGLKVPILYDPFEEIDVLFEGDEPRGIAKVEHSAPDMVVPDAKFSVSPLDNLSNGDIVTVTLPVSDYEKALKNGYVLTQTEKEYTVNGLFKYMTDLEEISENILAKLNEKGEDYIKRESENWNIGFQKLGYTLDSTDLLGCYLFVSNEPENTYDKSICYCVYRMNVNLDGEIFSYYYYVAYPNLMINNTDEVKIGTVNYPNGTIWWANQVTGEAFWKNNHGFEGYETLEDIKNFCMDTWSSAYCFESNVKE